MFVVYISPLDKRQNQPPNWIFYIILPTIVIGLIWILLNTYYKINDKFMFYYSGPVRGKIEIEKIRKIQHHSGFFVPVMLKPGLDTNGLILYYNQFNEIYISPKEEKDFIAELLRINPNIVVE